MGQEQDIFQFEFTEYSSIAISCSMIDKFGIQIIDNEAQVFCIDDDDLYDYENLTHTDVLELMMELRTLNANMIKEGVNDNKRKRKLRVKYIKIVKQKLLN